MGMGQKRPDRGQTGWGRAALIVLALGVAGCGEQRSARQLFGMEREAPDAFSVSTHAPLEVPAHLGGALPVPQPGAARPQEVAASLQARQAVWGPGAVPASAASPSARTAVGLGRPSPGEQALLQKAGAAQADGSVRAVVNAEAAKDSRAQKGPLDFLLFWRDKPQPGVVVNPQAEAERLKQNKAQGKAPTAGATPVVEDSGRLFPRREIK